MRYLRLSKDCWRKGRRIVELINGGLKSHLQSVLGSTSSKLRIHLTELSPDGIAQLLLFKDSLTNGVVDIITDKSEYIFHAPYIYLGGLCDDDVYGGGTQLEAKAFVRQGLAERDSLRNDPNKLNKVTVYLSVGAGNKCKDHKSSNMDMSNRYLISSPFRSISALIRFPTGPYPGSHIDPYPLPLSGPLRLYPAPLPAPIRPLRPRF